MHIFQTFLSIFVDNSIIIAGGLGLNSRNVEILGHNEGRNLPELPYETHGNSLIRTSNNEIWLLDGKSEKCFILTAKGWKYFIRFQSNMQNGIFIEMPDDYYMLGGSYCPTTNCYLPKNWKELGCWTCWMLTNPFPRSMNKCTCKDVDECKMQDIRRYGAQIHWGIHFNASGGHKISDEEFIVVKIRDVLKFNIKNQDWRNWGSRWYELKEERIEGQSIILDGKLIVTGGCNFITRDLVKSTEIMDLSTGKSWFGGDLNIGRVGFGMAFLYLEGKRRILAFGGKSEEFENPVLFDSIEIWNDESNQWEMSNMKLKQKNSNFGFLSMPLKYNL